MVSDAVVSFLILFVITPVEFLILALNGVTAVVFQVVLLLFHASNLFFCCGTHKENF